MIETSGAAPLPERRSDRGRTAVEVGFAFAVATGTAAGLFRAQSVSFIHNNLHALVAAVFLLLPQVLLRERGDIERYGFTSHPRRLGLVVAAAGIFGILPLFVGGFAIYHRLLCALAPKLVAGKCAHVLHPALRWPSEMSSPSGAAFQIAAELIVVALPEELFFRGYLQGRLEDAWPPRLRLFGARVGGAWLVSSALFAAGHYFVTFEPQMLTRFFPGLVFGWMFARTRSVLAGTLFHAACNLLMAVLATSFLT
jgi:membrane protease YdiL (CAAX protease family)